MSNYLINVPHTPLDHDGGYIIYPDQIFIDENGKPTFNPEYCPINFGAHTTLDGSLIHRYLPFNVSIGSYCGIARNVGFMGLQQHRYDCISVTALETFGIDTVDNLIGWALENNKNKITIGNDVWIGYGAMILPGANIPDGAVIGANSIITKELEPYGIYVGNPAKLIKFRFPESIIQDLLDTKWWSYNFEYLKLIKHLFAKGPIDNDFINHFKCSEAETNIANPQYNKYIQAILIT